MPDSCRTQQAPAIGGGEQHHALVGLGHRHAARPDGDRARAVRPSSCDHSSSPVAASQRRDAHRVENVDGGCRAERAPSAARTARDATPACRCRASTASITCAFAATTTLPARPAPSWSRRPHDPARVAGFPVEGMRARRGAAARRRHDRPRRQAPPARRAASPSTPARRAAAASRAWAAARRGRRPCASSARGAERRASRPRRRPRGRNILGARPSPPHIIAILSEFAVSHQTIVVLDFGSQYTQLIARRLRELSVYSEVVPFNTPLETLRAKRPAGIILSGGPKSVSEARRAALRHGGGGRGRARPRHLLRHAAADRHARRQRAPLGTPRVRPRARAGAGRGRRRRGCSRGCPPAFRVWASHGDDVAAVPPGFRLAATSSSAPIVAMEAPDRALYGLLFHPEVVHTEHGAEILRRFAFDVCGCTGDWTIASFIEEATARIRRAGRRDRQGRLRAVRRRRFDRRRAADPPGHRRPADLHLRGQRAAALRRGQPDPAPVRGPDVAAARLRGRHRRIPVAAGGRDRPRGRSGRSSAARSSTCSSGAPRNSAVSRSWGRERSIPTSSSRPRCSVRPW